MWLGYGSKAMKKIATPRLKLNNQLKFCHSVVRNLQNKKHLKYSWPFLDTVDPVALGIADNMTPPFDITSIKRKIESNLYRNGEEFVKDVENVFLNFIGSHHESHDAIKMARQYRDVFRDLISSMPEPDPVGLSGCVPTYDLDSVTATPIATPTLLDTPRDSPAPISVPPEILFVVQPSFETSLMKDACIFACFKNSV